jgi:uncharacterized protein YheU (UPF0270 family)
VGVANPTRKWHDPALVTVVVPPDQLSPHALRALIEDFVTSEGTDYGEEEVSLEDKVREVRAQIDRGEVDIVFDEKTSGVDLVRRSDARGGPPSRR